MSNRVEEFEAMAAAFKEDYTKFMEQDNKAAASRARKSLMEMVKFGKEVRKEITERKNSL